MNIFMRRRYVAFTGMELICHSQPDTYTVTRASFNAALRKIQRPVCTGERERVRVG